MKRVQIICFISFCMYLKPGANPIKDISSQEKMVLNLLFVCYFNRGQIINSLLNDVNTMLNDEMLLKESKTSLGSFFQVEINLFLYLSLLHSFSSPYLTFSSFLFLCFSLSKILTNYFGIVVKQFPAQNLSLGAGVNFINILCVPFLYESILLCFSLIAVWLCIKFLVQEYWR